MKVGFEDYGEKYALMISAFFNVTNNRLGNAKARTSF